MTVAEAVATATSKVLADRVVLVTGASGGLGSALSRQAAAAGATLILCGRRVRPLEKLYDEIVAEGGAQPAIYPIDLEGATLADYQMLAESVEREFGRLDGLVHTAAYFTGLVAHALAPPEDWLKSLQVNLNAPVALTHACLPVLMRSRDAAVIVVLDDNDRVGRAHWGAYGVAKFALRGLVSQWAAEWDNTPVRVCGLVPTPMRTRLRGRAYFAENPGLIALPDATATSAVELLSAHGKEWRGRIRDLNV
jgi:NAD(P)-dependent dehydrogenase (short-subunit alcohol dehydrogenase family)